MTPAAPPRRRPMQAAPLASESVVLDAFRQEAREWHASYKRHLHGCPFACRTGGLCPIGQKALDNADDADLRLARAIERERRL